MNTILFRAIITLLLWSTGMLLPAAPASAAARPNIVLIYADDLGYGDVGCYGATRVKTPHIDKLAAGGLRFTDAHATSSTCTPSRYSMLTGEYAWRKKGTGVLPGDAKLIIDPSRPTLASLLKSAGYVTGAIGKWHLGLGSGTNETDWNADIKPGPNEIGFHYSFIMPATGDRVPCVYVENHRVVGLQSEDPLRVSFATNKLGSEPTGSEPTGRENPELLKVKPSHGHDFTIVNGISRIGYMSGGAGARWKDEDIADVLTRRAVSFIEQNRNKPFFLYFSTHDIHVPRVPHSRFAGKTGMGPRGDVIVQLDWCVGEIMAALNKQDLDENTLVIFSSDNGPVVDDGYADDAVQKLGAHAPAGPWRGGKYSKFEGGTRVPFIVRWPARVKPGVSSALVCQVDFMASFAALLGEKLPAGTGPDTMNVLPALLGNSPGGRDTLVEHSGTLALRKGNWKFIPANKGEAMSRNTRTETGNAPGPQLYDLNSDPGEQNNLAAAHPDAINDMRALLQKIRGASSEDR
jgi:arylsulfatase A-like enzyme